jgi:hypothetical protein
VAEVAAVGERHRQESRERSYEHSK